LPVSELIPRPACVLSGIADMKIIRGKRAVITGAASGIGRALALLLAREGAALYLVDIDGCKLQRTANEAKACGAEVLLQLCDLSTSEGIDNLVKSLLDTWGTVDILINNAGTAYYGPMHSMTSEQWHRIVSLNLLAPIRLVHALLPVLVDREQAHILNTCSIFGLTPARKLTAYQTTKFGLVGFSLALRSEYSRGRIGVTALCPGFVSTTMLESAERGRPDKALPIPPAWLVTTPEHVARCAVAAIRRNRGLVIVSPLAHLMWWVMRLSPGVIGWIVAESWRGYRRIDIAGDLAARDAPSQNCGLLDAQLNQTRSDSFRESGS
jgi:short-subunit dehydrogenase